MRQHAIYRYWGLAILSSMLAASAARADSALFYNGDYDGRDALQNTVGTYYNNGGTPIQYSSFVYDDFVVPVGQKWTISSVFSNNQMNFQATSATWSIRQGVSEGQGGNVVASGSGSATQTTLTPVSGFYYGTPEYRISTNVPSVVLSSGTYFLTVAPNAPGHLYNENAFLETTSGQNSTPASLATPGNSFITNNLLPPNTGAYNYASTTTAEEGTDTNPPYDYSLGVVGTVTLVPEPALLSTLAFAGLTLLRGRRGAAAASHRAEV